MRSSAFCLLVAVAVGFAALHPSSASGAFVLTINDGTNNNVISDGTSPDINPNAGAIQLVSYSTATNSNFALSTEVDTILITSVVSTSNRLSTPTPGFAKVQVSNTDITNRYSVAKTITISFSDGFFSFPGSPGENVSLYAGHTYLTSGSAGMTQFVASVDNPAGTQTEAFGFSSGPNSGNRTKLFVNSGPYNLTGTLTVELDAGQTISLQAEAMVQAPAPPGFILFASSLPAAGLYYLRRRLKKA